MYLEDVTPEEIIQISRTLKQSHSSGYDQINPALTGLSIPRITQILAALNCSFCSGIFPDDLKNAKVIPLHKSDSKENIANYRPISVLPYFSKYFEKTIYNRTISFLGKHSIIKNNQFGFRQKHSTYMPIALLQTKISHRLDQGQFTTGVYLDLAKTFDTINHDILVEKLHHYGIRGKCFSWFESYLKNRSQMVSYANQISSLAAVNLGGPPGSILGPLLFLIYINDLSNSSDHLEYLLFADNTHVFLSGNNITELFSTMNTELEKLAEWFRANLLSLNTKKAVYMFSHKARKKFVMDDCNIYISNSVMSRGESCRFLGVIIDQHLSFKQHIQYLAAKISKNIGIIYRIRRYINIKSVITLYYSFIYPYLNYCNLIWACNYSTCLKPLLNLQKKFLRVALCLPYNSHTDYAFVNLNILKIHQINNFHLAILMYKVDHHMLPRLFDSLFSKISSLHTYSVRSSNNYRSAFAKSVTGSRSIVCMGSKIYSTVPRSITNLSNLYAFKKALKHFIINSK